MTDETTTGHEPLNREERRRERFGPHGRETGSVPTDDPLGGDSHVLTSNQGDLGVAGAGTGGATETGGRLPHHDGMNPPTGPNG